MANNEHGNEKNPKGEGKRQRKESPSREKKKNQELLNLKKKKGPDKGS